MRCSNELEQERATTGSVPSQAPSHGYTHHMESQLVLTAHVVVNPNDPGSTVNRKLGTAVIALDELGALKADNENTKELRQRTIFKHANFVRKLGGAEGDGQTVLVGKCNVKIEKKLLKPTERVILLKDRPAGWDDDVPAKAIVGEAEKVADEEVTGLDQVGDCGGGRKGGGGGGHGAGSGRRLWGRQKRWRRRRSRGRFVEVNFGERGHTVSTSTALHCSVTAIVLDTHCARHAVV